MYICPSSGGLSVYLRCRNDRFSLTVVMGNPKSREMTYDFHLRLPQFLSLHRPDKWLSIDFSGNYSSFRDDTVIRSGKDRWSLNGLLCDVDDPLANQTKYGDG